MSAVLFPRHQSLVNVLDTLNVLLATHEENTLDVMVFALRTRRGYWKMFADVIYEDTKKFIRLPEEDDFDDGREVEECDGLH